MVNTITISTPTAQWQPESSRKIVKRIVAIGTLVLQTPAHFGSGQQSGTEMIILEDELEKKPLLPGPSLAGALRHYIWRRERGYRDGTAQPATCWAVKLFGRALDEEKGRQSRVWVDDALGEGALVIRDGVKIDGATRTADDGALYSTQVWERGTTFKLRLELCIYEDDDDLHSLEHAFAAALRGLEKGEIPFGTRKHRGYGRASVDDWAVMIYDFKRSADLIAWLTEQPTSNTANTFLSLGDDFADKRQYLGIDAVMKLNDSLLIRDGSDVVDNAHLTSDGSPVLSGTSIAGALRARALKIAQSISAKGPVLIDDMFGRHGSSDNDAEGDLTASRLIVEEHLIENPSFDYIQTRVKIDRFTGGAFDTALFEEQPVFAKDNTRVRIRLELRYPTQPDSRVDAQAGLLLLLLKDLWKGDLALGGESNIGRGRLNGERATIEMKTKTDKKPTRIELNVQGLVEPAQAEVLQEKVNALWQYLEGDA